MPSTSVPDAKDWSAGQRILDDFRVERLLGEGGMGKVYLVSSDSSGQCYAVKRARFDDEMCRRRFAAELQTWIGLPEHPHLTPCRFFRTVDDEVVIFADFMSGGSLADAIAGQRLRTLGQMLDFAIQFALGLHAAHQAGVVHKDVKPGNVLLDGAGRIRVTDFGLSVSRDGPASTVSGAAVTNGGLLTPAYCSPEQAAGRRLTRATDAWSWALSVLEMFIGERTWLRGEAAPEVLEDYLAGGAANDDRPAMPVGLASLLQECFRNDPDARLSDLGAAAGRLIDVYQESLQLAYRRSLPSPAVAPAKQSTAPNRTTAESRLRQALILAGSARSSRIPPAGSARARRVALLAAYQDAIHQLQKEIAGGHSGLQGLLVEIGLDQAEVHAEAADLPGALSSVDRALLALTERTGVSADGARLRAWQIKAKCLMRQGNFVEALTLIDRSIAALETRSGPQPAAMAELARLYTLKANYLARAGRDRNVVGTCDRAIALYDCLGAEREDHSLYGDRAQVLLRKATALYRLGEEPEVALACQQQGHRALERSVNQMGRRDLAAELARDYIRTSRLFIGSDFPLVTQLCEKAQLLLEQQSEGLEQWELDEGVADSLSVRAASAQLAEEHRLAIQLLDRAISLQSRLVFGEGQLERSADLAAMYLSKSASLLQLGQTPAAIVACDQAIDLYEPLVQRNKRPTLVRELTDAYLLKADAESDVVAAERLADLAIALRETMPPPDGPALVARAIMRKAAILDQCGRSIEAAALFDRCGRMLESIARQRNTVVDDNMLAQARVLHARALVKLNNHEKAIEIVRQAIDCLEPWSRRVQHPVTESLLEEARQLSRELQGSVTV